MQTLFNQANITGARWLMLFRVLVKLLTNSKTPYSFMCKHLSLLLFGLAFSTALSAQSQAEWIKAGEKSYDYGDFANAVYYYTEALDYDTLDLDLWFRLGESNFRYLAYESAIEAFAKLEQLGGNAQQFPRMPYLQAKSEQPTGDYDSAITHFEQFLSNPANAPANEIEDAERQLENSKWAQQQYQKYQQKIADSLQAAISPINYKDVNTRYDDFAPQFASDQFYFSSLRFQIEKDTMRPARKAARILQRDAEGESASIRELPEEINQKTRVTGHTTFNEAGTMVYFTYCDYKSDTLDLRCDLYSATVDTTNGKWGIPQRLSINDPAANNTQPNVGKDLDGREYLYFASDRSGGEGGYDLYQVELLEAGGMGPVRPLTALNTPFNEVTPFYYAPRRELYFSTDGLETMGGQDVYRSSFNGENWMEPIHLGLPTNSSYNDVYYTRYEDHDFAYFASNRHAAEAIFWDEEKEVCCNDIYMVEIEKICVEVTTWHAITKAELNATKVIVSEQFPNGEHIALAEETHPNDNLYSFELELEEGRHYQFVGRKYGFKDDLATLVIDSLTIDDKRAMAAGQCIERKLYLAPPKIILEVVTLNKRDRSNLSGCTVELQSGPSDRTFTRESIETKADTNFYSYEIFVERYYRLDGTKERYTPDSAFVDTRGLFVENDTVIKRELLLEPILPPICEVQPTVFFHNDRPIKGSPHTITPANYMTTYDTYTQTHKPRYYVKWVGGDENRKAIMDAFFNEEVDKGADDLRTFAAMFKAYLEGGGSLRVSLQGFASPLSNGPYNDRLSARRCISVINYLWDYEGGVLRTYMKDAVIVINNKGGDEALARGIRTHAVPSSYKGIRVIRHQSENSPAQPGEKLVFDIKPGGEVPVGSVRGLVDTGDDSIYSPIAAAQRYVEIKVENCDPESGQVVPEVDTREY